MTGKAWRRDRGDRPCTRCGGENQAPAPDGPEIRLAGRRGRWSGRPRAAVARARRGPSLASPPRLKVTPSAASRCGKGSVLCGIAMAPTKWAWKEGSIAVSTFSMRRTTPSISLRAEALRSAMRAPVPAALPAEPTLSSAQSGTRPRIIACLTSIWLPKAPASVMRSTVADAVAVHQEAHAGIERRLGELDGAHIVLRDRDARLALADEVAEGAPVALDARACGPRARRRRRRRA